MVSREKRKLLRKYKVGPVEKERYVFDELRDFQILDLCRKLQRLDLSKSDRHFVRMAKTQLEEDWRKPLIVALKKLLAEYEKA